MPVFLSAVSLFYIDAYFCIAIVICDLFFALDWKELVNDYI